MSSHADNGGTDSVWRRAMTMHRVNTFAVAIIISAFAGSLAACDASSSPSIAGLGSSTTSNGRQQLIVSPSTLTLAAGSNFQLSTNAPTTLQSLLQWSTLNGSVATVSPSGSVQGQSAGTATISVRYSDDTTNVATATITVIGAPATANQIP